MGPNGIVINLGLLPSTFVKNNDCYLCIRSRSSPGLEVSIIWKRYGKINFNTIAEFKEPIKCHNKNIGNEDDDVQNPHLNEIMCSNLSTTMDLEYATLSSSAATSCCFDDTTNDYDLPEMLQNLLISVEHAIERIPLDDITFPCPQCLQYVPIDTQEDCPTCSCQCPCVQQETIVIKKDSSMQTSPMFEFVGSIPHIDSDEDDDNQSIKSGMLLVLLLIKPNFSMC